jgi:hypothetical protein
MSCIKNTVYNKIDRQQLCKINYDYKNNQVKTFTVRFDSKMQIH